MSSEKRKRDNAPDKRPRKKTQISAPVAVKHVSISHIARPILATTSGTLCPTNIHFQTYEKKVEPHIGKLIIHSSEHPTIDYIAAQDACSRENNLRHYVGIFDSTTNKLQLSEATKLTLRGSVRLKQDAKEKDEEDVEPTTMSGSRAALTETFGSRKSKKAILATYENRQLGQGGHGAAIAEAIMEDIKAESDEENATTKLSLSRINKPLPIPNLNTAEIDQVYSLSKLVVPSSAADTLRVMPIDAWTRKISTGRDVDGLRSRFVANRIGMIAKKYQEPADTVTTQQLQLLRYMAHLIEIAQYTKQQPNKKRMRFVDDWPPGTLTPGVPSIITKRIVQHFMPEGQPDDRAMTLLRTTIFALALHISPPSGNTGGNRLITETTDISLDLALKTDEVRSLFHELGCKVSTVSDTDLSVWGYDRLIKHNKKLKKEDKDSGRKPPPTFAILKFPLEFPKLSQGRRMKIS